MAQVLTFLLYIPFLLLSHFIKFIHIKIVDICKIVYSFTHHSITIPLQCETSLGKIALSLPYL